MPRHTVQTEDGAVIATYNNDSEIITFVHASYPEADYTIGDADNGRREVTRKSDGKVVATIVSSR
jgi:hypothetical protein